MSTSVCKPLLLVIVTVFLDHISNVGARSPFGPPFPITASWFKDRFSVSEWNKTLTEFQEQGGDTVILRAPPIMVYTDKDDIATDPDFRWCRSTSNVTGDGGMSCWKEAGDDLSALGLKVSAFATFKYEENFSEATVIQCPKYEKKIKSSRIYYRLVLPMNSASNPCDFKTGDSVMVLLTSFAGTDPHDILIQTVRSTNMSVYLGLPAAPKDYNYGGSGLVEEWIPPYNEFVRRYLLDHSRKYNLHVRDRTNDINTVVSSVIKGYYVADDTALPHFLRKPDLLNFFSRLGEYVHAITGKKLMLSPSIDLQRKSLNASIADHVIAFNMIAQTGKIDIMILKEGRGNGAGAYFYPTQEMSLISKLDPQLYDILSERDPELQENATFREVYTGSIQQVFLDLSFAKDHLQQDKKIELWLSIDAFEYLRDDPCLPVDTRGSGSDEMVDRTSFTRIQHALSSASAAVFKVAAFAWDPSFTCTTTRFKSSLASSVRKDMDQPMIANCSLHSPSNRSVVVIGYNIQDARGFTVEWFDTDNKRHQDSMSGYYFFINWGIYNNRVPSLQYIQLYDAWDEVGLREHGYIKVQVTGSSHVCIFTYDYRGLDYTRHPPIENMLGLSKYRFVRLPKHSAKHSKVLRFLKRRV